MNTPQDNALDWTLSALRAAGLTPRVAFANAVYTRVLVTRKPARGWSEDVGLVDVMVEGVVSVVRVSAGSAGFFPVDFALRGAPAATDVMRGMRALGRG